MSVTLTRVTATRTTQLFLRSATANATSTRIKNMSSAPNFNFPEKQPSQSERELVEDVIKLYQLKPSDAVYARYSPNATFHDPIGIANGLDSLKSQFNGMPKIFESSETKGWKLLENPEVKPPSVQFSLSQDYRFKVGGASKLVESLITLQVDPSNNLITKHDEEWDGQKNTTGEDGFFGKLNELRKKFTAETVRKTVTSDPNEL